MSFQVGALLVWVKRVYPRSTLAIIVTISLIVWFAGPLGTFEAMHPLFRAVYWTGLIFLSVPFAYGFRMLVERRLPWLSPPMSALAIGTGLSLAYLPVVVLATTLAARNGLAEMVPIWTMWAGTFLAAACAYMVRALLLPHGPAQTAVAALRPAIPRLLQRIDAALHGPLVSISVRDHYVDVRTTVGQASLLMRFSDAVAEVEGVEGAKVHRSHWVAWDAVVAVERQGANMVLRMADGAVIPVSRKHRDTLESRGLIRASGP